MIKKLLILFSYTIYITSQCRPSRDFIWATLEEQIDYAGIILIGNVTNVVGGINNFNNKVSMNNVSYYRGCGKTEVIVEGFHAGHLCGSGIPKVGDKIIVFACEKSNSTNLKINSFVMSTGHVNWSFANESKVKEITGKISTGVCRCARKAEKCLKRDDNICFRAPKTKSTIGKLKIPKLEFNFPRFGN